MKILTGAQFSEYQENLAKLENMSQLEASLAASQNDVQELTSRVEQLGTENETLQATVTELTSQVEALTKGSGVTTTKVAEKANGGGGDDFVSIAETARELASAFE